MKISTEIFRRVYDDDHGYYLTIRPDADGLSCVEVSSENNKENWGSFDRLTMSPDYARALAAAIMVAADEIEQATND